MKLFQPRRLIWWMTVDDNQGNLRRKKGHYIKVNGRCVEKHAKTQHIYFVWLLMKKFPQKIKDHTPESGLQLIKHLEK